MKQTDGLFHKIFREIAVEYPDLINEHYIVDIGAARLADTPECFDVVVMPNLYGDVLSDVAAQITGSVGLAGSANIGQECAMFEAIHGSAPDIAGQDLANPSGLIQGAVLMLRHIGQSQVAARIQNAWLSTIEQGIHTPDIFDTKISRQKVGTRAFAQAVIGNLGTLPQQLSPVDFASDSPLVLPSYQRRPPARKELLGVDVFVQSTETNPRSVATQLQQIDSPELSLSMITNRGIMVWPRGFKETFCTDHWRCRFQPQNGSVVTKNDIVRLLARAEEFGLDTIKTENLYAFDGQLGFSLAQGH